MKRMILIIVLLMLPGVDSDALSQSVHAFSYQGIILEGGAPMSDTYDLAFDLYDGPDPVTAFHYGLDVHSSVEVTDGIYEVLLDFGDVFNPPDPRWLRLSVRTSGEGVFESLQPLTYLAAVPYASHAQHADHAETADYATSTGQTMECYSKILPFNSPPFGEVFCDPGDVRTGGGCESDSGTIFSSVPITVGGQFGWQCGATPASPLDDALVVCCSLN